jgi:hypothetical protein
MRGFVGGIAQLGERLHGMQEVSGSIPLTSTKKENAMHRFGVISVLLGLALSVVGLVVGFTLAIGSGTGEQWFTLVPFGFVLLLLGVTLTQLGRK